jgi:hypothetical protein
MSQLYTELASAALFSEARAQAAEMEAQLLSSGALNAARRQTTGK